MKQKMRFFILFEAVTFVIAALIHAGILISGYEHQKACIAESVIATVLFTGLLASWIRPAWTRKVGLAAQGFAFLGTCVGVFTIVIGIGPRTAPDLTRIIHKEIWLWTRRSGNGGGKVPSYLEQAIFSPTQHTIKFRSLLPVPKFELSLILSKYNNIK